MAGVGRKMEGGVPEVSCRGRGGPLGRDAVVGRGDHVVLPRAGGAVAVCHDRDCRGEKKGATVVSFVLLLFRTVGLIDCY